MRKGHRRFHTFMERQKALLLVLLAVALLDVLVSVISIGEIGKETANQMQQLATLHMQQVYEEYSKISYDMRRLFMENQELIAKAQGEDKKISIYAKNNLVGRVNYSFGGTKELHPFFYFEKTKETLTGDWLAMEDAKESGILDVVLERVRQEEGMQVDLYRWEYFVHKGSYYLLRAYQYNDVWFICYVPAKRIITSLEASFQKKDTKVILFSEDGVLLSGKEKLEKWKLSETVLQEEGNSYRFPLDRFQVVREKSPQLGVSIAMVMKGYGGLARIVAIQAVLFFMVFLTLAVFIMMNLYTKKRIIAPVQKFVRGLKNYQEKNGVEELSVSDIHELEQVNEQFRNFVHQIGALKISVYEEKLLRQKMENDNLKLQLKPHFFLNTLGMICGLLDQGRIEEGKQMCMASIRYLRYLFRADMESVPIHEVVLHVEDYMEIMKLRYPGEIETDIYVEEEVKHCCIPPLIIQTLVENSLKYGKQPDRTLEISVTITIELKDENRVLCINVSDNGKGFQEEYLKIWQQGKELEQREGRHIGIANIRARLAFVFEGEASIKFYNSPLGGAVAELYLPMKEEEDTKGEYTIGG